MEGKTAFCEYFAPLGQIAGAGIGPPKGNRVWKLRIDLGWAMELF
jgi:hypothetical protein